jgi:hypothetical protein
MFLGRPTWRPRPWLGDLPERLDQGDEDIQGQPETDQVETASPARAGAEGRQQEAEEGGATC